MLRVARSQLYIRRCFRSMHFVLTQGLQFSFKLTSNLRISIRRRGVEAEAELSRVCDVILFGSRNSFLYGCSLQPVGSHV